MRSMEAYSDPLVPRDKILRETSPLSIFLVVSGSSGNRLLFRYPFDKASSDANVETTPPSTPGVNRASDSFEQDRIRLRSIIRENDDALCNMFAVNSNLCGQKFEIKINSTRHVGHPVSLLDCPLENNNQQTDSKETDDDTQAKPENQSAQKEGSPELDQQCDGNSSISITSFNIVYSLRASATFDIVDCYHSLSKRLAIALKFEENRCSYLTKEIKTILATLEENDMANMEYQQEQQQNRQLNMSNDESQSGAPSTSTLEDSTRKITTTTTTTRRQVPVYQLILERSGLAKDLRRAFEGLSTIGIVDLKINNWVNVSFCLAQKVHRLKLLTHKSMPPVSTRDIEKCLLSLRPYHGLLLLYSPEELLESLPIDASPACIQLIRVTKPDKNLMDLSVDANITLKQLYYIASQLIYWSKAAVIYPICDSNIYAIHPLASTGLSSQLVIDFQNRFPNSKSLHHYLSEFSEGTSLSQLNKPLLDIEEKLNLLSIVTWLLQKRILTQVHKYIFLVMPKKSLPIVSEEQTDYESPYMHNRSPKDTKLLNKLIPYFDGKHHIEDIMFFENLERSQILILCDKFREILFTCHYEDMAVSQLNPYESAR